MKRKGKTIDSDKRQASVAVVNIGNHRSRIISGKLLQFETARNAHLHAKGKVEQVEQYTMPTKGILTLTRKLPSEKTDIRFSRQCLEKGKIQ